MEVENREPKVFIFAGHARNGKNTCADFVKDYCTKNNLKYIDLAYSSYIKNYATKISNWDGREETKPRELLQQLGTNIIRNKLGDEFFIENIIKDIKVYSFFFDVITISDARFPKEIDLIKKEFPNVYAVHVVRPNFDNGLTEEQKNHPTETALDNYNNYDYELINDGTLDDLNNKVIKMAKEYL
jgi:hypothetical protein